MNPQFAASGVKLGLNLFSAAQQAKAAKKQYAAEKEWQEYRNRLVDLSTSLSYNDVTTNELLSSSSFMAQSLQIQSDKLDATGAFETSAAAAGVAGNSVNRGLRNIIGNAAQRDLERQQSFDASLLNFRQQREQIAMTNKTSKDYSYIPKPKSSTFFINAVANSL